MRDIVIQLISAFVGGLGFALIFNSGKKKLLPSTLGGILVWAVYLFFIFLNSGVFLAAIAASAFCQIYSEILARILKSPTTVFFIPAIVPLVPGGSLYYAMYYAALNDWDKFTYYGVSTLQVAFGIAVGASFVSAILLLLPKKKVKN